MGSEGVSLHDLFPLVQLELALEQGYVRRQSHPKLPLSILNYTEKCAYDRAWNPVTMQCRGLIYETGTLRVVARPFPKFFNHGEPAAPELDLDAPAVVIDKMDGSLGILYQTVSADDPRRYVISPEWAIATRGSFASEQAIHATEVWNHRYAPLFRPLDGLTYLFEIIYPENRIVCDYGDLDDLVLLDVIETSSGRSLRHAFTWPGPEAEVHAYATLAEALAAEPRPNAEGYVVYFPDLDQRVKVKQSDYVALHRILTGTNARHVWEFAAVRACGDAIGRMAEGRDRGKCWASFLGVDPARVEELEAVGDGWLEASGIPDEFYEWMRGLILGCEEQAQSLAADAIRAARAAAEIDDRKERFLTVSRTAPPALVSETMRLASGGQQRELDRVLVRAWRESAPVPLAPFQRSEAVA